MPTFAAPRTRKRPRFVAAVAAMAAPLALAPAHASSPPLDPSFGGDGKVRVDFARAATTENALDLHVDDRGRTLLAGAVATSTGSRFALARLRPDGRPDRSFGGDGRVSTGFPGAASARAVAVRDGRVTAVGTAGGRVAVARYRADGGLAAGFGGTGKVVTDVTSGDDVGLDVRSEDDGAVTVAARVAAGGAGADGLAVLRYRSDGTLDPAFGDGGVVLTPSFPGELHAARLMADGRLLAVGAAALWSDGWVVARYAADGTPDPTFGEDGVVTTTLPRQADGADAWAVLVQPDGKVVVGGTVWLEGDYSDFALARYLPDGSLDPGFGTDGTVVSEVGTYYASVFALARQADGKIVAAGSQTYGTVGFAVARYRAGGALDRSFSGDGVVRTFFAKGVNTRGRAVAVRDGRIVVAGELWTAGGNPAGVPVARYRAR